MFRFLICRILKSHNPLLQNPMYTSKPLYLLPKYFCSVFGLLVIYTVTLCCVKWKEICPLSIFSFSIVFYLFCYLSINLLKKFRQNDTRTGLSRSLILSWELPFLPFFPQASLVLFGDTFLSSAHTAEGEDAIEVSRGQQY